MGFPLISLLYLNVSTLTALRRLVMAGHQRIATDHTGLEEGHELATVDYGDDGDGSYDISRQPSQPAVVVDHCHNHRMSCVSGRNCRLSTPYSPPHSSQEDERRDSFLQNYANLLKKRESRLTRISISIVWLFIFCHIWKLVPTFYELLYSEDHGQPMTE